MRPAEAATRPRAPQVPLRDRLHMSDDLRTRLRDLLSSRDDASPRVVADVLRRRNRAGGGSR